MVGRGREGGMGGGMVERGRSKQRKRKRRVRLK